VGGGVQGRRHEGVPELQERGLVEQQLGIVEREARLREKQPRAGQHVMGE
jgi:hypothetical protein